MKIGIIGAGSFGTTLGHIWANADHDVLIWAREPEIVKVLNEEHRNPMYHSDVSLSSALRATGDLAECIAEKDAIVLAVPSKFIRDFVPILVDAWEIAKPEPGVPLISIVKGILYDPTELVSNLVIPQLEKAGGVTWLQISGPNLSGEIIRGMPTASVLACRELVLAGQLQAKLSTPNLRIYTSTDTIGVEVCGAVKNVLAIACGMARGLSLGSNAMAVLVTRGLLELKRIVKLFQGETDTAFGLSGLGDLIVTGFSEKSRNFQAGMQFAMGKTLNEIEMGTSEVAEGIRTVKAVYEFARGSEERVELPIISEVYQVIYERKKPGDAIATLMNRPFKMEKEG